MESAFTPKPDHQLARIQSSGGRMDLGIGRGDSARRVLGKPPTTLAIFEAAAMTIRELCEGRAVELYGRHIIPAPRDA